MSPRAAKHGQRGWCPSVRRPMETGDGLLVRVHPSDGALTAAQARIVAGGALEHGNGLIDVTARGNLQIRGVRADGYPRLVQELENGGLAEPAGEGPARLTLVSPMAGLDPDERFGAETVSADLVALARGLSWLPDKIFVAIDGGGLFPLAGTGADLVLAPGPRAGSVALSLAAPDGLRLIGSVPVERAATAAGGVLLRLADMRRAGRTRAERIRQIEPALWEELARAAEAEPAASASERAPGPRAGPVRLRDGRGALLAALPFGHGRADLLARAADWSDRHGSGEIRLSFTRGLLLPNLADEALARLADEAARVGLIVMPEDPRLNVTACSGAPACAGAASPTRADATRFAEAGERLIRAGARLHVSGCAKGCAHPARADLTLIGGPDGRYGFSVNGTAKDHAPARLEAERIEALLRETRTRDDLARAFGAERS